MIAMIFCALAIASMSFAGGCFIYLPLIPIVALSLIEYRLIRRHILHPKKLSVGNHWRLFTASFFLIASIALYASVFQLASTLFADRQFAAAQRDRIQGLENPERLRDVAIQLHARLICLPTPAQDLDGTSDEIPAEIAALKPVSIRASDDHLFINMCQNPEARFGLLVYPEATQFPVGVKVVDRLFYWEGR